MVIHGTTLATNALIERRGARTALVTTEGFRDVIEMRTENRFEQYDLNLTLPPPLIPREHRFSVKGRMNAGGQDLSAPDRGRARRLADTSRARLWRVAIGFIHAYANPAHERRAREILARRLPQLPISISCRGLAADARVRAVQHRLRQRLCQPADGGLSCPPAAPAPRHGRQCPVVHDPFRRRADLGRDRVGVSRSPGRIRPGGRRDLRGRHCAPFRSRQGGVLRHGRHDGEDLPDRGLRPQDRPHLRGRAHLPLPQGLAACPSRSLSSR